MSNIKLYQLKPPNYYDGCKCCGQCCSAFYTSLDYEEMLQRADCDESRGLTMLNSDAVFIARYCTRLSPDQARLRSPGMVGSPGWPDKTYWTCQFLRDDKLCQLHLDSGKKPRMCSGYPWYGARPKSGKWMRPGCGYREDD